MSSVVTRTSGSPTRSAGWASSRSRRGSMPQLIKDGAIADDRWRLLREATSLADVPDGGPAIVPLALWLAQRDALRSRGEIGVWLKPPARPDPLAAGCPALPPVAHDFPQITDG